VSFACCSTLLLTFTLHRISTTWPIYVALLLNGAVRAFNAPASQAILPLLVEEQDFPNAVAWASSLFQTATIVGPIVGGVLYGITGSPVIVYSSCAASYLTAFTILRRVHFKAARRLAESSGMVLEGLRYVWQNKLILGAVSLDLFAVLLGGAVALLPVYAREILHIGATGLGMLRGAPGIGAVGTAIAIAFWPLKRRAGFTMLLCVFAFGAFTIAFGISRNFVLSLAMLMLLGASDMVSVIVRHTMIQLATPDEMRGRVSAVNTVFIGASNEVGQFESGITAQWFGTVPAVVLGGIGTVLIVMTWSVLFPALRRVDTLEPESLLSR
jgi:MFS family permease